MAAGELHNYSDRLRPRVARRLVVRLGGCPARRQSRQGFASEYGRRRRRFPLREGNCYALSLNRLTTSPCGFSAAGFVIISD